MQCSGCMRILQTSESLSICFHAPLRLTPLDAVALTEWKNCTTSKCPKIAAASMGVVGVTSASSFTRSNSFVSVSTTNAMDGAATLGHLGVVKWLHENRSEGCTRRALNQAACRKQFDVVEWLLSNRSEFTPSVNGSSRKVSVRAAVAVGLGQ